jgi:hypothetical protein
MLENLEGEVWKDIIGYEGQYQVSNLGRVKSMNREVDIKRCKVNKKEKIMSIGRRGGYSSLQLCKNSIDKSFLVHRLVALAFIPNYENKRTVNHINGIKTDNRVENLEWATDSEQVIHAIKTGLNVMSDKHKRAFFEGARINKQKLILHTLTGVFYDSIKEAAFSINMKPKRLSDRLTGKKKNKTNFIYA